MEKDNSTLALVIVGLVCLIVAAPVLWLIGLTLMSIANINP